MKSIGLAALIFPETRANFFLKTWPREPFVVHGLNQTIQPLKELPFLQSLDILLNSWPFPVSAHLPDVADESSAIDTTAQNADKLFKNKMGLLFNNVQRISPVLQNWLQALQNDLGLPQATVARCMVYATPDGKGTAPHFDQNINFVVQLQGIKKWQLDSNTSVQNPTQRHTLGQPVDPELASYMDSADLPKKLSKDRQEIILKPGSMLFVPQGYWHSTEAEGSALALNFTFSQPCWADLLTAALRSRLLLSDGWRELADGVNSSDKIKKQLATSRFEALLTELIDDLPHWEAGAILAATEGHNELDAPKGRKELDAPKGRKESE